MMRHLLSLLLAVLLVVPAWAADKPTQEQVKALTLKAATQVARDGI